MNTLFYPSLLDPISSQSRPRTDTPESNSKRQEKLSNYFYTKKKFFFKALKDMGILRALKLSEALATPSLSAPSFPAPIWSGLYLLPACDRQARPGPPRDLSLPSWRPVPSETDPGPLDLICFSVCRVWGGLAWRHGGHR